MKKTTFNLCLSLVATTGLLISLSGNVFADTQSGFDTTQSDLSVAVQGQQVMDVTTSGVTVTQGVLTSNNGIAVGNTNAYCGWGQGAGMLRFNGSDVQGCNGNGWTNLMGTVTVYQNGGSSCWAFC